MKVKIKDLYDFLNENDLNLNKEEILVNSRFGYKKIEACEITAKNSKVVTIVLEDNSKLSGSPDHKVFCNNNWVKLKNLNTQDFLYTKNGFQKVIHVINESYTEDLYDLQVKDVSEYYTNGIVSHNSTIHNVLKFALYGKVANTRMKDIPNRLNRNCEVEVNLKSNGYNVNIKRGLEPSYFTVNIDGLENFGDQAGKLNVQDNLESEIFGMPFYVFSNIISLSVNDFKSFIKMNPSDKREIIDRIIGLSIINKMYDALKTDVKEIVELDNSLLIKNNVLESQLNKTSQQLEEFSIKLTEINDKKQDEINEKINLLNDLKKTFKEDFASKKQLISEVSDRISDNKHLIQEIKFQAKNLETKIKLYSNAKCPECESDLHTDWHEARHCELENEQKLFTSRIDEISNILADELTLKKQIETEINTLESKIRKIDNNNLLLREELSKIQDISYLDEKTTSLKEVIESTSKEITEVKQKKKNVENKLQFYKIIEESLSEKGIKQLATRTIIPTINANIHNIIKELNLDFRLTFAEDWSCNVFHLGQEISPATLSTGENKKLDMAVILAIIKLMKLKFPGLNVLFLDEVISSLDTDSTHHILHMLGKFTKELNMNIFVVNHAPVDGTQFDYKIEVSKTNGFSNILTTKLE